MHGPPLLHLDSSAQWLRSLTLGGALALGAPTALAAEFSGIEVLTNRETVLRLNAPAGSNYVLQASTDLRQWQPLATLTSTAATQFTDSAAPYLNTRFYRTVDAGGTNVLTGDHLLTDDGDVVIHPINHATLVLGWQGLMIYVDPVGGSTPFRGLARADLILVTHEHSDHFDTGTLNSVKTTNTVILASRAVFNGMSSALKGQTTVLTNGASTNLLGLALEAVPAYNLTTSNHPKGTGNGYILTIGGKRLYFSGDTEDIPEMRALRNVDAAFLAMNVPYTMTVDKAAKAVREFQPRIVYPYHYRNQNGTLADLNALKRQVGSDLDIEVRVRKWY